jgi:hypothetical protein
LNELLGGISALRVLKVDPCWPSNSRRFVVCGNAGNPAKERRKTYFLATVIQLRGAYDVVEFYGAFRTTEKLHAVDLRLVIESAIAIYKNS